MKKIFKFALASVVVAFAGFGIYQNMPQEKTLSDFALENIEALSSGETIPSKPCFKDWEKAKNDDPVAFWEWICDDCESYWLLYGNTRNTCKP